MKDLESTVQSDVEAVNQREELLIRVRALSRRINHNVRRLTGAEPEARSEPRPGEADAGTPGS